MANGHGGFRAGSGRPRKDLASAIVDGTRPSRLKAVALPPADEIVDADTPTIPECETYLVEAQRDGVEFQAKKYFEDLWEWLAARKCTHLFSDAYLQRFCFQQARVTQLEQLLTKHGFLAKKPDGSACANPFESMLIDRLKIVNNMAAYIESVVRQYCAEPFTGLPGAIDPMEALLSSKR